MQFASGLQRVASALPVWAARALTYFLVQGVGLLAAYAMLGFHLNPDSFPSGLRLDPVHAAVHAVWGAAAFWIGFFRPRHATGFLFVFAAFYLALALFGTFTQQHFGMRLAAGEIVFHWLIGPAALLIALFGLAYGRKAERALR